MRRWREITEYKDVGELERSHALNIKIFLTGADLGDDDICDIAVKKDEKI